jgi:hypothetical protein
MLSICAARQIKPQIYTAEGQCGALRYTSARFSKEVIQHAQKKFMRRQGLTLATFDYLSGICQIRS